MRRLLLAAVLCAGCAARAHGPAWPKSAGPDRVGSADEDGGESLAPHQPVGATAVEQAADDDAKTGAAPAADEPDADDDASTDETPAAEAPAAGGEGATITISPDADGGDDEAPVPYEP